MNLKFPAIDTQAKKFEPQPEEAVNAHKLHDFYKVQYTNEKHFKDIVIEKVKFVNILMDLGFRRYTLNKNESRLIRLDNNTIEEINEDIITDCFMDYVEALPDLDHGNVTITAAMIKAKLYNSLETYFKPALFKRMKNKEEIIIKEDTKTEKYFFYRNVWVTVTATGYQAHEYTELTGYIWKDSILPREFTKPEAIESYFEKFCTNIAGKDAERLESLKTIIGYNLHSYFQGKMKATIFTDSRMSADGEANGRTGKGIISMALSHMVNANPKKSTVYVSINGKDFNVKNINKYADCNLDTRIVVIDDIYNNYDIENAFVDIVTGITVRKLFQSAFTVSVKMIFTTNKTIMINGESAKDRVIQFELADYYNSNYDPSIEFGHWFFDDWLTEKMYVNEFSRFDVFMFDCVSTYLAKGLKEAAQINLRSRTLQDHTSQDFINYMDDLIIKGETVTYSLYDLGANTNFELKIVPGEQVVKRILFEAFKFNNPDFNNSKFSQIKFTKWVRLYAKAKQMKIEEERKNSKDYFTFIPLIKAA